jgi:hypothetical protein
MARIRSIKPEFPHSESMGRVSRDARLTFIEMWTLADDAGRLRGNSRMLASLLFPYDDDAKKLMDGWLGELEGENCIQRYVVDGTTYIQICNWLTHQKIDKPSPSKLPAPEDGSRTLSNPREDSRPLAKNSSGSGSGGEGKGEEGKGINVAQERDVGPADRVFAHWRLEFGHPRAQLDTKRRKVIAAALVSYDEATVCAAISGYKHSPHHMGENERRTVYDDIELFLRDAKHIEAGLNFARAPPVPQMSAVERAKAKLQGVNGNGRVVSEQFRGSSESGLVPAAGMLRRIPDS